LIFKHMIRYRVPLADPFQQGPLRDDFTRYKLVPGVKKPLPAAAQLVHDQTEKDQDQTQP